MVILGEWTEDWLGKVTTRKAKGRPRATGPVDLVLLVPQWASLSAGTLGELPVLQTTSTFPGGTVQRPLLSFQAFVAWLQAVATYSSSMCPSQHMPSFAGGWHVSRWHQAALSQWHVSVGSEPAGILVSTLGITLLLPVMPSLPHCP